MTPVARHAIVNKDFMVPHPAALKKKKRKRKRR